MGNSVDNLEVKLSWGSRAREAALEVRRGHQHGSVFYGMYGRDPNNVPSLAYKMAAHAANQAADHANKVDTSESHRAAADAHRVARNASTDRGTSNYHHDIADDHDAQADWIDASRKGERKRPTEVYDEDH